MAKPKVTTKRIAKLYAIHKNFAKVGRIVGLHITSVRCRLVTAGIVK
jgi:hypothetical protein